MAATGALSPSLLPCRYALTGREVVAILKNRLVQVDGKVRTDKTYPVGFMDTITIPKTGALAWLGSCGIMGIPSAQRKPRQGFWSSWSVRRPWLATQARWGSHPVARYGRVPS